MLKIGVRLPRQFEDSGDYLADARAMESAGADSLWLEDEGDDPWLLLAGMATVTSRIRLIAPVSSAEPRDPQNLGLRVAVEPVARFREREKLTSPFELWAVIKMPDDRETWRRLRREYEEAGATGIIVPLDPRLLDLVRNGDEEEDRSDLGLAQG